MSDPRVFYSRDVVVRWLNYLSLFEVVEPFDVLWVDDEGETLAQFTVEAGFLTDGPSIPKRLRSIVPWYGHHLQPSVVHDWLYEDDEGLSRLQADDMFLDGMEAEGVSWLRRYTMYRAVRAFGSELWGPSGGKKAVGPFPEDWDVLG